MPGGVLTAIQAIGVFAEGFVLDVVYIDDQPVPMLVDYSRPHVLF
jgi:hypothetical protein